jgi:hypothetical protein
MTGRLTAWHVVRHAAAVARNEPWRVLAGALIVFGPFVALQIGAQYLAEDLREHGGVTGFVALALLPATTATLWGGVLYAGLLDRTVGAHHYGHRRHATRDLLRELPIGRLIAADLLLVLIVVVCYAFFVLPALVAFTLFALVGPMITIEDQSVTGSFKRSARLVWPHFFLAFVLVTLPVALEEALIHGLVEALHGQLSLWGLVSGAAATALVGSAVGLLEVTLAYELIHRDSDRAD